MKGGEKIKDIKSKMSVIFCLYKENKEDFNFDEIESQLNLSPSYAKKWHEFRNTSNGTECEKTVWEFWLTEQNCQESFPLLLTINNLLLDKRDIINKLCNKNDLKIEFGLSIHADDHKHVIIRVPKEFIDLLRSLNSEFYIDQYYYKNE